MVTSFMKYFFKGMFWLIFCIDINTHSKNEKVCKKLFSQDVLIFIDPFYFIDAINPVISSTQSACDVMCVQHVIQ